MMTTMTNKYPGKCETCSCPVAAGAGQAVKTAIGWRVRCPAAGCSVTAPAVDPDARLRDLRAAAYAHGDDATVALVDGALGGDNAARRKLASTERGTRAHARAADRPTRRSSWDSRRTAASSHPWAHDEE